MRLTHPFSAADRRGIYTTVVTPGGAGDVTQLSVPDANSADPTIVSVGTEAFARTGSGPYNGVLTFDSFKAAGSIFLLR